MMQATNSACLCSRHQAMPFAQVSTRKSLSSVARQSNATPASCKMLSTSVRRSVCIPIQAGKGFGTPKPKVTDSATVTPTSQCPCQSGKEYQACCQVFHLGAARAETPEQLLRSRYCAYVVKDPEYIADTTHPECSEYSGSRKAYVTRVTATQRALDPRGLTIKAVEPGATEDEVFIDFMVKRSTRAKAGTDKGKTEESTVDERSRFIRDDGKWFWMSSSFPEGAAKLSRP